MQNSPVSAVTLSPVTEQGHPWRGYFFIAAATFCWGAAVTFGKAIFNGSFFAGRALLSPMVITQARTSFTVLVLGTLLFLRYGRKIFRIGRNDLVLCALVGTLGVACSNYFYYLAVQMSTVSLAITVQYTAPVWVLLYMVARGKEKGTLRKALAVLIAIIGIALVIVLSDPKVSTVGPKAVLHSFLASLGTLGARAAFLASFGYAFYNVAGEGLVKRNHQFTITFYVLLSAALLWLVVNPPWRLVQQHFSIGQWEFLFLFACFSMVLPYMLYFSGLKYLDPTRAVITSCLEPVFAILFAVTFVHERLHPLQVAGIVAVLGATVMVQVQPEKAAA